MSLIIICFINLVLITLSIFYKRRLRRWKRILVIVINLIINFYIIYKLVQLI